MCLLIVMFFVVIGRVSLFLQGDLRRVMRLASSGAIILRASSSRSLLALLLSLLFDQCVFLLIKKPVCNLEGFLNFFTVSEYPGAMCLAGSSSILALKSQLVMKGCYRFSNQLSSSTMFTT